MPETKSRFIIEGGQLFIEDVGENPTNSTLVDSLMKQIADQKAMIEELTKKFNAVAERFNNKLVEANNLAERNENQEATIQDLYKQLNEAKSTPWVNRATMEKIRNQADCIGNLRTRIANAKASLDGPIP